MVIAIADMAFPIWTKFKGVKSERYLERVTQGV